MTKTMIALAVLAMAAVPAYGPAYAGGDAAKGEKDFKQCQTCHSVVDAAGETLAGKGAKVGPNLYGVFGRVAGSYEGFKYGESIIAAGAAGLVWNEADFVAYVQNPSGFLQDKLADKKAKGKMVFKVKNTETAEDLYAYLSTFSPAPAAADGAAAPATEAAPAP
jgi:cytochrome c